MFRLIVLLLLGMGIAAPSSAADYKINLSALDALETSDADSELPLPVVKKQTVPARKVLPQKKPVVRVKKSVEPAVKTRSVRKTSASAQEPKKEEIPAVTEEQKTLPVEEPAKTATAVPAAETGVENVPAAAEPAAEQDDGAKPADEKTEPVVENAETGEVRQNIVPESPKAPVSSFDDRTAVLVFDEESAELNAGIVKALTGLTGRIETENPGKITIEAYNYDDGEGSFSRKRLSLSRAVAVRSWLLGKGCKSFGIKIINTEDVSLRNNIQVSL